MKQTKLQVLLIIVALVFSTALFSADAGLIEKLQNLKNPKADFKVEFTVDKDPNTLRIHTPIVLSFKATKNCHLTIVDRGQDGSIAILFPNKFQPDNKIEAGKTYTVPGIGQTWKLQIAAPAGTEVLKAIATLEPHNLIKQEDERQLPEQAPFRMINQGREANFVKSLEATLKALGSKKWAEGTLTFKVSE